MGGVFMISLGSTRKQAASRINHKVERVLDEFPDWECRLPIEVKRFVPGDDAWDELNEVYRDLYKRQPEEIWVGMAWYHS